MDLSLKDIAAQHLNISPPFSVIKDIFGYSGSILNEYLSLKQRLIKIKNGTHECLEAHTGFLPNPNGLSIENSVELQSADWGTFVDTFGSAEIEGGLALAFFTGGLADPEFTTLIFPFYGFYTYFFDDLATGMCTGISGYCLERFWKNQSPKTYNQIPVNTHPTDVASGIRDKITVGEGRLLSKELLLLCHDQCREGLDNVEHVLRTVISDFSEGSSLNTAPSIMFLPSGALWDENFYDGLLSSHTVTPYRFVSAVDWNSIPDGGLIAQVYIYDNNNPNDHNRCIEFFKHNGRIHYRYDARDSSTSNITLGMASLNDLYLQDVDLPFSGPGGLTTFVLDFLLSPATVTIKNKKGKIAGYKNGKIHCSIPGATVSPFCKNLYLLPAGQEYTRTIQYKKTSKRKKTYSYVSINPGGTFYSFSKIISTPMTNDIIRINPRNDSYSFVSTREDKKIDVAFGMVDSRKIHVMQLNRIPLSKRQGIQGSIDKRSKNIIVSNPGDEKTVRMRFVTLDTTRKKIVRDITKTILLERKSDLRIRTDDLAEERGKFFRHMR